MNKAFSIFILLIQIVSTFIAIFIIYMIFALLDSEFGIDGLFGLFLIQPVFAVLISSISIFICLILGLPIRLNKKINSWWINHFYITIIAIFIGIILFFLSFLPILEKSVLVDFNEEKILKKIPNLTIVCISWFLITFSILHSFPPKQLTNLILSFSQNFINKFKNLKTHN